METTLPLPFLVSVNVPPGLGGEKEGLNREEVSSLGCVFFEVAPQTLDKILRFLGRHNTEFQAFFDVTRLDSRDDIITLLDAGARKVFVRPEQLPDFAEFSSRVAPILDGNNAAKVSSTATNHGLLVSGLDQTGANLSQFVEETKAKKIQPLFIKPIPGANLEEFLKIAADCNAIPILSSTELSSTPQAGKLSVPKILAATWKSDRADGLIPTVVVDEHDTALGLVYSSEESVGEALKTQTGVYQSRKRGLWYKGATSGDTQELVRISLDCDNDALKFVVRQKGRFCHLEQSGCFGDLKGLAKLESTLLSRKQSAPAGSYTARLFSDEKLLRAKIMEEAEELCDANTPENVAFEAADLIYFALTKAVGAGVTLADIEKSLDAKSFKVKRRTGDAKGKWAEKEGIKPAASAVPVVPVQETPKEAAPERITMKVFDMATASRKELDEALRRPSQKSSDTIMKIITPIIDDTSPVLKAPFPESLMQLPTETIKAMDVSFENIRKFHAAQKEEKPLQVETIPGVVCSRFSRPPEAVGLYVPGGTAVLPSTAFMLGVPAMVAACKKIVLASPPRSDAVAAMAYGTESVSKVDKILGPGNQFVTAAKMFVSNDTNAGVGIDMPAGPSEVLVIADKDANPAFVASDLLSQAEHGVDSQVILIAIDLTDAQLLAIEDEVHKQAMALPRVDIVRGSIAHSLTVRVKTVDEAMEISNQYAPEHLILQIKDAESVVDKVMNAGSVFIGEWTPESVGDYSAGVNHSLPTYGYAKQYSGVNLASFVKHITSSNLTAEGLRNVGEAVMQLAKVEELEAHRRAVSIRLAHMDQ
ncbi:hypothetical protein CHGG_00882 [Chaetomium globosum CBS 148.51]|uniref:Histidine biosynthesis trifunctional protein n=1 Tax=Chaetomium globosum (strain ATCC 6205 / CBS 148.51 / DSM 1962 / NBRC 6347 / NRRL 1970) TaxID=306901 RepID=Q2HFX2_CHAGB|nr:uncharacterized protein CHGG_00882 [Chaetomium globosum CBS 148.51]EAQ92647.1 hypothetical protein CHGG_00882 [Chaetomium globosum CBS 148.51]